MPFIDLNKNANSSGDTGGNVTDDQNTATPPAAAAAPAAAAQNIKDVQVTTDPTTGARQVQGADFPPTSDENLEKAAKLEQAMAAPTTNAGAQTVQLTPQPQQQQRHAQMTSPSSAMSQTPQATQTTQAPQPPQPQSQQLQPQQQQESQQPEDHQPAELPPISASDTELVVGTNQQNQAMADVMDRSLPKLEAQSPQQTVNNSTQVVDNIQELKMEDEVQELKTQEEKISLESKDYGLDDLLKQIVALGASDLHLTAGYRAMARVDGRLQIIKSQVLTHESIFNMMKKVVAPADHVDINVDKDIDVSYDLPDANARFRVNVGYQRNTITSTFRLIPNHIRTPEELRLPPVSKQFTKYAQGLVLVTGPTGSGKSTTLASLVNQINMTEPKHIITIEDPVEYTYPKGAALVDQRAVHIDTKSWPTALRAALRQDPDVVLIGEMRDVETMEAALQVAETGHLVFSTLHTNTAAQTIDRVIDAFPEDKQSQVRTQLSSVLNAVISQRLVPVTGGGRRLSAEVMVVTAGIRNAIREGKVYQIDNMIQTGAELGMVTMEKSLSILVREGQISTEDAQRYANKPDDLMSLLGKT